jgi:hypothetical protein
VRKRAPVGGVKVTGNMGEHIPSKKKGRSGPGDRGEDSLRRDRDGGRKQGSHAGLAEAEPGAVLRGVLCLLVLSHTCGVEHADGVEHAPAEGAGVRNLK